MIYVTPSRPVTCMPLAREFNEVVAMDLKVWDFKKNIYFLHLIDMATRFSISTVIYKKEKRVIIDQIIEKNGLAFSGKSKKGNLMEMIELNNHIWYVGCQFHPEFTSSPIEGHPLFNGFINAASKRKV